MNPAALTSNPEFKRNLWLSLTRHRLIAIPALLGLVFLAIALSDKVGEAASNIYATSIALFIFLVWLWGARDANAAIVDELRDKTWDQQRMSALTPWAMTWGKLFGAPAINWYGGAICLAVMTLSGIAAEKPVLNLIPTLIAVGVLLHASLIAANLHASKVESRIIQRGGFGWLVIVMALMIFPQFIYGMHNYTSVNWWGLPIDPEIFMLGSALLFAACATFSAWRVMCGALQVRTLPWAWPLFACILAAYVAGFIPNADTQVFAMSGLIIASSMSYAALFSEPTDILVWRRLRLRQQAGNIRGFLEHLPLWPTSLLLAFIFALITAIFSPDANQGLPFWTHVEPFTLVLMVLRDACILLFFTFSRNAKRALGATVLYLLVIDLLLPFLMYAAGLDIVAYFFLPLDYKNASWVGLLVIISHTIIAMGLVKWRLGKLRNL